MCVSSSSECSSDVKDVVQNVVGLSVLIAVAAAGGEIDIPAMIRKAGGTAKSLAYGICEAPTTAFYE